MSVEFKARLPLSEQEMCCGYDDLAGPAGDAVRPQPSAASRGPFCEFPTGLVPGLSTHATCWKTSCLGSLGPLSFSATFF